MGLQAIVEAARNKSNLPLAGRLTAEQLKELSELAKMYAAGELVNVSWKVLADDLRLRWNQVRLQPPTLKRNILRLASEHSQSGPSGRAKKVSR